MKHEPTYVNCSRKENIAKYCYKYGMNEGIEEMMYHYHLRKDETKDLIAKALKFELITEYSAENLINRLEL